MPTRQLRGAQKIIGFDRRACYSPLVFFTLWGWRAWVLLVLAAAVVASYFGVLPVVEDRLQQMAGSKTIERLAGQEAVAETFKDPSGGRMDAYVVMFLFVFLSPLALVMAVIFTIFVLSALATHLAPLVGGERIALIIVTLGAGIFVYVKQDLWLPHAAYFLGLLARAYIVIVA
jgi:hypothetical protein